MGIDGMDNLKNLEKPKYVGDLTPESLQEMVVPFPEFSYQDRLDSFIHRHAVNVKNKLDEICCRSLELGDCGVKVTTYLRDGSMLMEISPDVPFGEIHYHHDDSGPIPPVWQNSPISEHDA